MKALYVAFAFLIYYNYKGYKAESTMMHRLHVG